VLARLRRVISRGPDVRAVVTATRLLARIDEQVQLPTSPFLQGFIPPSYLTPLTPEEGRTLLARGGFSDEDVELVVERTSAHPFLQLLASRLFESRDWRRRRPGRRDEMIANYFASTSPRWPRPSARAWVAREGSRTRAELTLTLGRSDDDVDALVYGLTMLGYLAQAATAGGSVALRALGRQRVTAVRSV
jgi:hypothetical protein